jgi:hypothetical protein
MAGNWGAYWVENLAAQKVSQKVVMWVRLLVVMLVDWKDLNLVCLLADQLVA